MINLTGYNDVKASDEDVKRLPNLPCGEYVCKIIGAKNETIKGKDGKNYEMMSVAIDIAEGRYKDYFAEKLKLDQEYYDMPKWKAVLRFFVINKFSGKVDKKFKKFLEDVAASNENFKVEGEKFDEKSLRGKKVGVVFEENVFEKDGRQLSFIAPTKTKFVEEILQLDEAEDSLNDEVDF